MQALSPKGVQKPAGPERTEHGRFGPLPCSRIVPHRLAMANVHKARPHRRRSCPLRRQREDRMPELRIGSNHGRIRDGEGLRSGELGRCVIAAEVPALRSEGAAAYGVAADLMSALGGRLTRP